MTDTEDYFDYALTQGIDPMNYPSFGAYWTALQKRLPVQNWDAFPPLSKTNFFRDFRDRVNAYRRAQKRKAQQFAQIVKQAERRRTIKHKVRNFVRVGRRKVAKAESKRTGKKVHAKDVEISKSEQKRWDSIQKKSIAGKKLNKTENKMVSSARMTRVWEIKKLQNTTLTNAWKQAKAELDL